MEKSLLETLKDIDPENAELLNTTFQENGILVKHLHMLSREDIKEIIPQLSVRIEFESNLKKWKNTGNDKMPPRKLLNDCLVNLTTCLGESFDYINSAYKRAGILEEGMRRTIVQRLFLYCQKNNIKATKRVLHDFADQVTMQFPTESKEAWFSDNGKACGKLVFGKYNYARQFKNGKEAKQPKDYSKHKETKSQLSPQEETDCKAIQNWLRTKKDNDPEIISNWKKTLGYRKSSFDKLKKDKNINTILQEWPSYKLSIGSSLLEIDFNYMYPEKEKMSFKTWENFTTKIKIYLEKNCKENLSRSLLSLLKDNTPVEGRDATILFLLHSVLKPGKKTGAKGRYTIRDSQKSFIRLIEHPRELEAEMNIQPYIFVVGDTFLNVKNIFVRYDNITYTFESVLEALTCCFYIFTVFNFQYPNECSNVWKFLQSHIFGITFPKDKYSTAVLSLIQYLEK